MLTKNTKDLLKNLGFTVVNYSVILLVITLIVGSWMGYVISTAPDYAKLLDGGSHERLRWALSGYTAMMIAVTWYFINRIIAAVKRQKELKWE